MNRPLSSSRFDSSRFLWGLLLLGVLLIPLASSGSPRLASLGAVQLAFSQCGCMCVEGVAQTLCTSVEEAQRRPSLCGLQHCPEYVAVEDDGTRYVSPTAWADDCRDVRVWDGAAQVHAGIKVCDVLELGDE